MCQHLAKNNQSSPSCFDFEQIYPQKQADKEKECDKTLVSNSISPFDLFPLSLHLTPSLDVLESSLLLDTPLNRNLWSVLDSIF